MKKGLRITLLSLAMIISFVSLALSGASGRESAALADAKSEQEIRRELENFRQAYLNRDEAKMALIFAEDSIVTYSSGRIVGKADYVRAQTAPPQGQATRESFEYEEVVIHQYGDTIVLSTVSVIKGKDRNGAPVAVRQRATITTLKQQGRWKTVAMHLTILP